MEDLDDECTTIIKIHKNFDEKFRDYKRPRLGGCQPEKDKSSIESKWWKQRLGGQQNESDVISLKANISQLNMVIQNLEKQLAEEKIIHKKQLDAIICEHENLKKQAEEMKRNQLKITSKYETAKEEIFRLKADLQLYKEGAAKENKSASLLAVQMELEEAKQLNHQMSKSAESEIERLKNAVANVTSEVDVLRVQLKNKSSEFRKLEADYEGAMHQLSILNQQIKDFEHERSKEEQSLKQSKWVQSRLVRCEELEEANKHLKSEVSYLKATKENLDLLNEKCRSLQDKLERSEKRCSELDDLKISHEFLKKKMSEFDPLFTSIPTLKCTSDIIQLIESLNHTNQVYAEANGSLKTSLHKCEDELTSTQAEVQKMRVELMDATSKCELVCSQSKGLKQKLQLIIKERDSYKNILDAYESEMTQTLDSTSQRKFKILEETCEGFKKQCLEKDAELQKLSDMFQNLKRKIALLEQQLVEEKHKVRRSSNSNADSNVILTLQEKIVHLQMKLEKVCEEKETLELRLENLDSLGHYNPAETKVVQMKNTPFSMARDNLTRDLESLKEENQMLKMKVKTMLESGQQEDLTSRTTQALASIPTFKEKEELQSQLMSSELLNKRLKEKYEEVSNSFKSMVARLLGYKVERTEDGTYKLASIFAESPDEFFIFVESQDEVFTLMENEYLYTFEDLVKQYLVGSDALPAFMSAVTLSLKMRHCSDTAYDQSALQI